jgi:hypothetical protein
MRTYAARCARVAKLCVFWTEIGRVELVETTALGAAFLAGLGVGVWKDQDAVRQTWREQRRRFKPTTDRAWVNEHLARWDAAVAKAWSANLGRRAATGTRRLGLPHASSCAQAIACTARRLAAEASETSVHCAARSM